MNVPDHRDPAPRLSRRRFLAAAALVAGSAAGGAALEFLASTAALGSHGAGPGSTPGVAASPLLVAVASPPPAPGASMSPSAVPSLSPQQGRWHYRSRPDLTPPIVEVAVQSDGVEPGLIFFTPGNGAGHDGPTIVDEDGEPVWVRPGTGLASANFAVGRYQGQPVLSWWEGTLNGGNGKGEYVLVDNAYREILRVGAQNGYDTDLHEFQITPDGTALLLAGNLHVGPNANGRTNLPWSVVDNVVQEVDLRTGRLLFEWHTADHIDPDESFATPPTKATDLHDYVHANSIDVDTDGNLLISARNTSAVYKVDRNTGRILWRLGGKRSDFQMGLGAAFGWQHDARRRADGTITLFDDEAAPGVSRAIALTVDESARAAALVHAFTRPVALLATSQGSMQVLPNGNAFVGWGSQPYFTEFAPDGEVVFDATFAAGGQSYRTFRNAWVGRPAAPPSASVDLSEAEGTVVYASWNGATEVASWQILGGAAAARLAVLATAPRLGFETAIRLPARPAVIAARALDASGATLGTSPAISVG